MKVEPSPTLADKYTLAVIDIDALIEESIKWSESADAEVMLLEGTWKPQSMIEPIIIR